MSASVTSQSTPTQLVQGLYDAYGRGDLAYILERIAPDCVWRVPGETIPVSGVYNGPSGAAEFFRKLSDSQEMLRFEPREFFPNGNDVVALGYEEFRSRRTGKATSSNWAMLFRTSKGSVTYFELFADTEAASRIHQP